MIEKSEWMAIILWLCFLSLCVFLISTGHPFWSVLGWILLIFSAVTGTIVRIRLLYQLPGRYELKLVRMKYGEKPDNKRKAQQWFDAYWNYQRKQYIHNGELASPEKIAAGFNENYRLIYNELYHIAGEEWLRDKIGIQERPIKYDPLLRYIYMFFGGVDINKDYAKGLPLLRAYYISKIESPQDESIALNDLTALIAFYKDFLEKISLVNVSTKEAKDLKEGWLRQAREALEEAEKERQWRNDRS